jgi:hypothetical protein
MIVVDSAKAPQGASVYQFYHRSKLKRHRGQKREAQAESTEAAPTGSKETTQVDTDGPDPFEQTLGFLGIGFVEDITKII